MASELIQHHREGAEIFTGHDSCKKKLDDTLEEFDLPKGLLPMKDLEEVGHNRSTGFVWLKQKQKIQHWYKRIRKTVSFDQEITAFIEPGKMKEITGAKVEKYFIGITVSEMYRPDPASDEITFAIPAGISMSFPITAFQEPDKDEDVEE